MHLIFKYSFNNIFKYNLNLYFNDISTYKYFFNGILYFIVFNTISNYFLNTVLKSSFFEYNSILLI